MLYDTYYYILPILIVEGLNKMEDDEFEGLVIRGVVALERIADSLEAAEVNDAKGMDMAKSFTDMIKMVIEHGGDRIHRVDVPPTVGDGDMLGINAEMAAPPTVGDVVPTATCEQCGCEMGWDPDNPDPKICVLCREPPTVGDVVDDTTCPNCGEGRIKGHQGHAAAPDEDPSSETHWHCEDCKHIWPYVMHEERP